MTTFTITKTFTILFFSADNLHNHNSLHNKFLFFSHTFHLHINHKSLNNHKNIIEFFSDNLHNHINLHNLLHTTFTITKTFTISLNSYYSSQTTFTITKNFTITAQHHKNLHNHCTTPSQSQKPSQSLHNTFTITKTFTITARHLHNHKNLHNHCTTPTQSQKPSQYPWILIPLHRQPSQSWKCSQYYHWPRWLTSLQNHM